jgi:diadenosine tetraphosphate (Ap4A) HIT family hydrolase
MEGNCSLCIQPNEEDSSLIDVSEHWRILINYSQPTLGSLVLVSNRHVAQISDLTPDEYMNGYVQMTRIEEALGKTFQPVRVNYMMLANGEGTKHVHYHVSPRYESPVDFGGRIWVDDKEGKGRPRVGDERISHKVLNPIIEAIREKL